MLPQVGELSAGKFVLKVESFHYITENLFLANIGTRFNGKEPGLRKPYLRCRLVRLLA